LTYISWHLIL